MKITELVLKVTNACNLNCKYCFVFNQGDTSYKTGAPFISEEIALEIIYKIKEHCEEHGIKKFHIIFHGGEPLLLRKSFYSFFVHEMNLALPDTEVGYALQTNGTLLTDEWIEHLNKLNISIGLSIDGPRSSSKNRIYRSNGAPAYDSIIKGLNLLHKHKYPAQILSVINPMEAPKVVYEHLKENNIAFADYLFPDKTYDNRSFSDSEISEWLISLFDLWYDDNSETKPEIRLFEITIGLILGLNRGNETMGLKQNEVICIKPDGQIQAVDSLMVCGNGFTQTSFNIKTSTFDDALNSPLIRKYINSHQDAELSSKCRKCIIKTICGGGSLAHRYSKSNEFQNPSVYCPEIFAFVLHIQNRLVDDLTNLNLEHFKLEKLTTEDFKQ